MPNIHPTQSYMTFDHCISLRSDFSARNSPGL